MSKILITDDNPQNLYLARVLLEQRGHDISEAYNGQDAVDTSATTLFDLVIMDIQIPVVNALEAAQIIKQTNTPPAIVVLTTTSMSGDSENIFAAGCDGYITKPLNPRTFGQQVESYLKDTVQRETPTCVETV